MNGAKTVCVCHVCVKAMLGTILVAAAPPLSYSLSWPQPTYLCPLEFAPSVGTGLSIPSQAP